MKDLLSILEEFPKKRVMVIGDIMLDHYLEGKSTKTSPEAPILIISVEKEWFAPGGAGNTAVNATSLGAKAVLVGEIGADDQGKIIDKLLFGFGVSTAGLFGESATIVKFRILHDGKHIMRADKDGLCKYADEATSDKLQNFLMEEIENCDAILVSDYAKGIITEKFARDLVWITQKHKKMLIVDTKPKHLWWYEESFCIKPNKIEAEEFSKIKIESMEDATKAGNFIKKVLKTNVLLTLGSMGMILFEEEKTTRFSSNAKDVFDVTGAGDTVLAVFGLALASGASMTQAVDLANHAAAIVIAKSGTASVTLEELKNSIS